MKNLLLGIGLILCLFCACPPTPAPVPGPAPATTDGPDTLAQAACRNLAGLGCSEGQRTSCAATLQKTIDQKLTDLKPACLIAAKSVTAVQACGTVACP